MTTAQPAAPSTPVDAMQLVASLVKAQTEVTAQLMQVLKDLAAARSSAADTNSTSPVLAKARESIFSTRYSSVVSGGLGVGDDEEDNDGQVGVPDDDADGDSSEGDDEESLL